MGRGKVYRLSLGVSPKAALAHLFHVPELQEAHTHLLFSSGLGYTAVKNSNLKKDYQTCQK
jgi:hypothetical protein